VLVVAGEPGVGKTALLQEAVAAADGMRVILVAGVESEAAMPFGTLFDVCRPFLGSIAELPDRQRQALEGARAMGPAADGDRFAIGADRFTTDPDGSAGVRAAADAALRRHVEWADTQLAGRDWLVGGERSAADIYLFMMTRWGRRLEPPAWDSPHLGAHFARMLERPGVRRMMTEQGLLE
jgi:hypothetical protein